ncbi:MAG: P-II family nitrogen regulator [Fibrobacterales bacterium]
MKKIEAYIKEIKKREVIERLHKIDGLTGLSITRIEGYGRSRAQDKPIHVVDTPVDDTVHVRLDIVCSENIVQIVLDAIEQGAHTGLRSDGKIYVSTIDTAIRISTGDRGDSAV